MSRTEAGGRLLDMLALPWLSLPDDIAVIEAEAVRIALTELRGEVEALPFGRLSGAFGRSPFHDETLDRAAVLALIDKRLEETK